MQLATRVFLTLFSILVSKLVGSLEIDRRNLFLAYILANLTYFACMVFICVKCTGKNRDKTKLEYVERSMFAPKGEYKNINSTVSEYDCSTAKKAIRAQFAFMFFNVFIYFKFKSVNALVFQTLSLLCSLCTQQLFAIHILKRSAVGHLARPWNKNAELVKK